MSQPFMGELRMFGFNYPPKGWAFANGQTMSIAQNQALFALMGTTYGGNGTTTFLLPNLQGSTAMHRGTGFNQGQVGGEANVTLVMDQMPAHNHPLFVCAGSGTSTDPSNFAPGQTTVNLYAVPGSNTFDPGVSQNVGNNQPHNNMPPYLVINWCVALVGIFPSRN